MNKQGFTLIETLIYTAIIGGLIVSFTSFALGISQIKNKTFVIQETQSNIRNAMNMISTFIREAEQVSSPQKGVTSNSLVLEVLNSVDDITISLSGGTIYYQSGSDTPLALVSDNIFVNSLSFQNNSEEPNNDHIVLSIDASYKHNHSIDFQYNYQLETSTELRN